jgi:hypothetical protein
MSIERLGMFPFKVQLFRVARMKQNLLIQNLSCNMLYDAMYCWRHITKPIQSTVAVVQKEDCFQYVYPFQ